MEISLFFFFALLSVSIMYSTVGHGGASGYLAVMSIFAISTVYFRSSALILNLVVAGIAFVNFRSGFKIRWRLFLLFVLPAIPMVFFGALIRINPGTYKFILGILLLLALMRLLYRPSRDYDLKSPPGYTSICAGWIHSRALVRNDRDWRRDSPKPRVHPDEMVACERDRGLFIPVYFV